LTPQVWTPAGAGTADAATSRGAEENIYVDAFSPRRDHADVGNHGDVAELVGFPEPWITDSIVVISAVLPSNALTSTGIPTGR